MKKKLLLYVLLTALVLAPACTGTKGGTGVQPIEGMPQGDAAFPWWNHSVFYEIFVRSFYDSNGDGIGDFNGIVEKLDYLNDGDPKTNTDLGITGIWLMPIFPSPTYHGYGTTDFYAVNPDYGTLDDFKRLLQEAHKRGIRVIIDLMLNHTSNEHPWFRQALDPKSPYRDWYIWSADNPGYNGPWGESVWHKSINGDYYYGVFVSELPDLNYDNPQVVEEVNKVVRFWLEDVKVDGFRLDGARYLVAEGKEQADSPANHAYLGKLNAYVKGINPQALVLGEVWTTSFAVAPYVKQDQLDLAFEFDLASAFMKSAGGRSADNVRSQSTLTNRMFPAGSYAPFLTNHDQARVMTEFGGDLARARNAASLLLTSNGVPFIYYGEEIGMIGGKPDEHIRSPMQWTADVNAGFTSGTPWESVKTGYKTANVAVESSAPDSLLSYYRQLVALRNQHVALRTGEASVVESKSQSVFALLRAHAEEIVLVVVNLGETDASGYNLKLAGGPLAGSYQVVPLLGEGQFPELAANASGGFDAYEPLATLPANTTLILRLSK